MLRFLFLIFFGFTFPLVSYAIGISKQVACKQPDGLNQKSVYILWKGEIPYVDSFVKYNGKLYYFIHQFRTIVERDTYRKWSNSPLTNSGFVISKWSSLVEYDCSRSKVTFLPIQDTSWKSYGKLLWMKDGWIGYTFVKPNTWDSCRTPQDAIIDLKTKKIEWVDTIFNEYPTSTENECYTRSLLQYTGSGVIKLKIERKSLSDNSTSYYPYLYNLVNDTWKLLEKWSITSEEEQILTESGTIDDFISHKRIFTPGITFTQTDTTTNILYHGKIVKRYQNKEYPITLLRNMVTKQPDCANSQRSTNMNDEIKNDLGKEYLRQCLIMEMRYYPKDYILFFGPSIDGHTVSLYDISMNKFFHHIIGTTTQIRFTKGKGIIFMVNNPWLYCNSSIWHYRNGKTKKVFDECTLENKGWSHVVIDTATFWNNTIDITYRPLLISGDSYIQWGKQVYSTGF